jgi:hypothetical protein
VPTFGTYFILGQTQDFQTRLTNTLPLVQVEVQYLLCKAYPHIPSDKTEYHVCVTIPKPHPKLQTAWSQVPPVVGECNSNITFESKKLVDFQMKSFANIHKIPVFILFSSVKKCFGWNQFTTDPVVSRCNNGYTQRIYNCIRWHWKPGS